MSIEKPQAQFLLGKKNFMIVGIGIGFIVVGLLLMMGGGTTDPKVYNPEEIYSSRRIVFAPIMILIGFGLQIYAILAKPASRDIELEEED